MILRICMGWRYKEGCLLGWGQRMGFLIMDSL